MRTFDNTAFPPTASAPTERLQRPPSNDRKRGEFQDMRTKENQIRRHTRDIELTKKSLGYHRYLQVLSKRKSKVGLCSNWFPVTPRANEVMSCSQWSKRIQEWRKLIHNWTNLEEDLYKKILNNPTLLERYNPSNIRECMDCSCNVTLKCVEPHQPISESQSHPFPETGVFSSKNLVEKIILPPCTAAGLDIFTKTVLSEKKCLHSLQSRPFFSRPVYFVPKHFKGTVFPESVNVLYEQDLAEAMKSFKNQPEIFQSYDLSPHLCTAYGFNKMVPSKTEAECSSFLNDKNVLPTELTDPLCGSILSSFKNTKIAQRKTQPDSLLVKMRLWHSKYRCKQKEQAVKYFYGTLEGNASSLGNEVQSTGKRSRF